MEAIDSDSDVQSGSTPGVSIKAEIAQFITFATHQCDVAVIANLVVLNPLERDLEDLTLHLVAEPKVLGEHTWRIDRLHARSEFPLRDRRVSIAGGLLDLLNERMRAEVTLQLRQGETILAEARHPIVALARNEWGGANYMPELLAAFVTPNDPAVQRILKEASQILEASGKSGAIDGYQSKSRKRSWEIVAGLWAAVSRRGLTYAEPPASFGRHGQKIRLPSMIEEQGLATCLDTALLFAAAIEQAGLNPVVVFTEDHALAGAWLQPQFLRTLTVEDPIEIRKAIDQNELVLFETTMVTGGHAMPFSRALAEGRRQVLEANENAFVYAIDIKQARGRDIQPLSSLVRPATGIGGAGTNASRAAPPLDEAPDLPPFDIDTLIDETPQTPAERLERWKRSLLDLSKRNRLLNLKPSATAIPIFCPDAALLEDKIAERKRISLITPPERKYAAGEVDTALYHLRTGEDFAVKFATEALGRNEIVANVAPKELEKGVLELYRKAKADFEEGGSNTLFLALGMLRWAVPEDPKRSYRAPLILLPVKLERRSAASKPYLTAHEDEPVFNLTLLQMLRQDFDIEIPGLEGELPSDDSGINVRQIWETVRTRVREVPGFEVVDDIVLSTFSFAKYLMWKDLAERTEVLKESPFVRHIIDTPRESYRDGAQFSDPRGIDWKITPSEIMAPLNADSSQIVAIHASGKNGDFVLEGPPGTGKSETIGNIIAHNLGLGHRVLFVSEKMAALEVVYRRLDACGLGDFCLELHSAKANKREVINKLGVTWEKRHEHPAEEWHRKAAQLADLRDQLNRLVEALHRPGPGGISPRDAVGRSLRFGDVHRLRLDWERDETGGDRVTSPEVLASLVDLAKRVGQQFSQILPEDIEAFKDISYTDWSYGWAAEIVSEARKLKIEIENLARRRDAFVDLIAVKDPGRKIYEVTALGEIAALVPDCAAVNLRFALEPEGRDAMDALEKLVALLEEYRAARKEISSDYGDDHIAPGQPLRAWLTQRSVVEAKIWPIRILARRGLRKAIRVGLGIDAKHAPAPERDLEALIRLAELRTKIDAAANSLPPNTPWLGLDADLELLHRTIRAGRHLREAVTKFASFGRELMETRALFIRLLCHERDRLEAGMPLAAAAADFVQACSNFNDCHSKFRNAAGNDVPNEEADLDLDTLSRRVDALVTRERRLSLWCAWVEISREAREAGLGTLVSALETGAVTHHHAPEAFKTAYACWLAPILIDARPELTRFSAVRHEDLIRTFRSLDEEFAKLTGDYIRAKLSAKVSGRDEESADPGYGVLVRELQKKMKHKPVRQLVSEMGETLTTLTPCLMMSPLSVAQFLPANVQAFDLVVFDEASQITVPDAIGAIARGKRCVVVGDPQQMPPTSFFERGAEDDENEEVRDLESILDEALAARVPHHRLTGHYRSRHESLICFSNHAYYDGALVTYPSADTRETAVTLRQTDGVYAKGKARTNATEAKAVVAEIVRRLRDPELNHLSIGVVTLNAEQQRLIEDLLDHERRADPELERFFNSDIGDPVFVKNLETVQGDQRDVILLSIGYGPTEPGGKTMSMNFGPLNRQGGERRFNVAITRATTEVVVFTSFDASMIDLTRTSAKAVNDLKHYIDFAARGPIALGEAIRAVSTGDYDSDFELAVAEKLRNLGWTVRTQIGVSKFRIDLGVVHPDTPGRFLAGIECDGATYHSSPSARDRDRVRHIILEQLGWRLFRVWSTDFFLDPETSIRVLDEKLRLLLETDRNSVGDVHSGHSKGEDEPVDCPETKSQKEEVGKASGADYPDDMQVDETAFDVGLDQVQPLDSIPPSEIKRVAKASSIAKDVFEGPANSKLDAKRFYEASYQPQLKAMAIQIIDAEGPITFKRLSDLIARAHGFQRTGKQISSAVWNACARVRTYVATPDGHKVFWPYGAEPEKLVSFRGLVINGERRDWREVPHPEKLSLVQKTLERGEEDLARAVAEAIGVARLTPQFRAEIDAIKIMLQKE